MTVLPWLLLLLLLLLRIIGARLLTIVIVIMIINTQSQLYNSNNHGQHNDYIDTRGPDHADDTHRATA